MTEITQADRDAAKRFQQRFLAEGIGETELLWEAFARHRTEATEALSAENERLREAFKKPDAWLITDGETYWVTGFEPHPKGPPYCEIIPLYRAALGD